MGHFKKGCPKRKAYLASKTIGAKVAETEEEAETMIRDGERRAGGIR